VHLLPRLLVAALALLDAHAAPSPRPSNGLVAPVRCVGDYLEAVAAAAPARPRSAPLPPSPTGTEPRWLRARAFLSPRVAANLDAAPASASPLAPWRTLGRDGALLGYEILAARRAPRGAVVVVARERMIRAPDAPPASVACTYLVAPVRGEWRIADKRCGRDFANAEILGGYTGYWDEPDPSMPSGFADDAFDGRLE
jgi:hypothetical protein